MILYRTCKRPINFSHQVLLYLVQNQCPICNKRFLLWIHKMKCANRVRLGFKRKLKIKLVIQTQTHTNKVFLFFNKIIKLSDDKFGSLMFGVQWMICLHNKIVVKFFFLFSFIFVSTMSYYHNNHYYYYYGPNEYNQTQNRKYIKPTLKKLSSTGTNYYASKKKKRKKKIYFVWILTCIDSNMTGIVKI